MTDRNPLPQSERGALQVARARSSLVLRSGLFQDEEDGFGEGNWASRLPLAERPRKVLRYDLGVAPHS